MTQVAIEKPAGRTLDRDHLAFFRGYIEGVDPAKLWEQYLYVDGPFDAREASNTVRWIRDQLSGWAIRSGRRDLAELLVHDPQRSQAVQGPSLEEFASQYPEGFYTQAELEAMWREETGAASPGRTDRRRMRLVEQLTAAVLELENVFGRAPSPSDPVGLWLRPELTARLEAGGIATLGALTSFISQRGFRWWSKIRQVGPEGAARIIRWLQSHESALGKLSPRALAPLRKLQNEQLAPAPRCGIVPLERFLAPERLDGRDGSNRATGNNELGAGNDQEAVEAWLRALGTNQHTARAYRKEAERMLLWAILEREKAMSSLDVSDCAGYKHWLAALGQAPADAWLAGAWRLPQEAWIGPKNAPRWSEDWRPFDGPLAESSQRYATGIAKSLFEFLCDVNYMRTNPFRLSLRKARSAAAGGIGLDQRSLSDAQMQYVLEEAALLPGLAGARLRAALWLGLGCGLRISEIAGLRVGDIDISRQERPALRLSRKGGKDDRLPLPSPVLAAINELLRERRRQSPDVAIGPDAAVICRLRAPYPPLSLSNLHLLFRGYLGRCGAKLQPVDPIAAAKLFDASAHWLRHTWGTLATQSGTPINVVQRVLGHSDLRTTTRYVTAQDEVVAEEMEEFARLHGPR